MSTKVKIEDAVKEAIKTPMKVSKTYTLSRFKDVIEKLKLAGLVDEQMSVKLEECRKEIVLQYVAKEF